MRNLEKIVKNYLPNDVFLMDINHKSGSDFIRITVDSYKEIDIEKTSFIAKKLKNDDDFIHMFPEGARLEVSTPGIGNELTEVFQYKKNIGRKVFLEYKDNKSEDCSDLFQLIGVEKIGIKVEKDDNESFIKFVNIKSAKVKISFC